MFDPTYRPPGIYELEPELTISQPILRERGLVGFIGLAERGPLDVPVRIVDINQFYEIYGNLDENTYLEPAVQAFFQNGGAECYVLRIAHVDPRKPGEIATLASNRLLTAGGKPSLDVYAINEGAWANVVNVETFPSEQIAQTFLTLDLKKGQTSATVKSTHGIARGSILRVYDEDGNEEILEVANIEGRVVHFQPLQKVKMNHPSSAPTYLEPIEFGIRVSYLGRDESFDNLSPGVRAPNYFETAVNSQSAIIQVADRNETLPGLDTIPALDSRVQLSGGQDGLHGVTPDDFMGKDLGPGERSGLAAFEIIEDVDVLCIPDLMWAYTNSTGFNSLKDIEVVQQALVTQCENQRDRFCILDLPNGSSPDTALQWRQLFDTAYAAFYFPWVQVDNGQTPLLVPPSGIVSGVYARCDLNIGLHKAPANEELLGALDVAISLNETDVGVLNNHGINCIRSFNARGIRVWGARTTSSDPMQRYITVRRVMSAAIRTLQSDLQWVMFEPNNPALWKKILRNISYFLYTLWQNGYLKGGTPEQAFFVKCDEDNNPIESRERGYVVIDVGLAPVRPAEFVFFRVVQENELSTAGHA